jgi:hypothetical protein
MFSSSDLDGLNFDDFVDENDAVVGDADDEDDVVVADAVADGECCYSY